VEKAIYASPLLTVRPQGLNRGSIESFMPYGAAGFYTSSPATSIHELPRRGLLLGYSSHKNSRSR
jgi:hypothetical protein